MSVSSRYTDACVRVLQCHSCSRCRGKGPIIRVASLVAFALLIFVSSHHFLTPSTSSLWTKVLSSPIPNSSRSCPDASDPDYFKALTNSVGTSASNSPPLKQPFEPTSNGRQLMHRAGGLDIAEFAFFAADASGQLGGEIATRRGILALRKFEPGSTLMSLSFDAVFSIDQMHRSQIAHLLPYFRERGMDDMLIMTIALL